MTNINDNKWKAFFVENIDKYGSDGFGFIYRVFCKKTGISYVGQSADINLIGDVLPNRIRTHYNALRRGCHSMRELQESWDRYSEYFDDEFLEAVPIKKDKVWGKRDELTKREKHWQDVYKLEGSLQLDSKKHYQLKESELKELYQAGIINTKTLIYFVLKLKNPWCDRPVKIDPIAIAADYDIPESSAYKAILQLKDVKVLRIGRSEMVIQWCQQNNVNDNIDEIPRSETELSDPIMDSRILESIIKSENELSDLRIDSQILENRPLESLSDKDSTTPQTIQTDQTIQTNPPLPPQGEEERGGKEKDFSPQIKDPWAERSAPLCEGKEETDKQSVGDQKTEVVISPQSQINLQDPFYRRRRHLKNEAEKLPDGPWMIDGKLDGAFQEYLARKWMEKYKKTDLFDAKGDVLAYFQNQPHKLASRWQQYTEETMDHFKKAKFRAENGIEIKPDEQARLLSHARAITNPLPQEMSLVAAPAPIIPPSLQSTLPKMQNNPKSEEVLAAAASPEIEGTGNREQGTDNLDWQETIPDAAENPQAYKPYQPPQEDYKPLTPEQMAEIKKRATSTVTVEAQSTEIDNNKFLDWAAKWFYKHEDCSMPEAQKKAAALKKNPDKLKKLWAQYKQETTTIFDVLAVSVIKPISTVEEEQTESECERLQRQLNDSCEEVRKAALAEVRRSDKYFVDFDGFQYLVSEEGW